MELDIPLHGSHTQFKLPLSTLKKASILQNIKRIIFFFTKSTFWSVKSIILIRCIRDVRHFKAVVLPFLKCTITFL